jgi:PAT family beta-lactamase induction signal transducer AmpG
MSKQTKTSPWAWVPSLYFAEGIPYVVVMTVSVIMYKRLGISNTDIALYTSWLYLPWVIKPFWSPLVDLLKTKRWWIVTMQLFIGAGLAGVAFTIPAPGFFQLTLAFFWLLAFSSATHDIAADGFYMLGLDEHTQAYFIGIRSTFYRLAMITGQGLLIILAGFIESSTGLEPLEFEIKTVRQETQAVIPKNVDLTEESEGKQVFILTQTGFELGINGLPFDSAKAFKQQIHELNVFNGFVMAEKELAKTPSWWSENVSNPLKASLKRAFGKDDENVNTGAKQGNMVVVGIRLAMPPAEDEKVVLNLDRFRGDKDLSIVEGQRLVFTPDNWNVMALVAIQADPKLDGVTAATFQGLSGSIPYAWSITFFVLAGLFVLFFGYHRIALPKPAVDVAISEGRGVIQEFWNTFISFFKKDNVGVAMAFFLLFRLGESQLVKLASPFLLDNRETGGLGLTTGDVGLIYGTIGIVFLTLGGILGGWVASRNGLKYWIWWMAIAMNLPNLTYVYLSIFTPENMWLISSAVAMEQFGYGFGFTAYMLYMIYFAEGKSKTAHFAICTGLMALGMMIPGMISGWLQEIVGYQNFFIWVMLCTIPGFFIIRFLRVDPAFGIKRKEEQNG